MNSLDRTGVIILAAGSSSRLGQPKQLVTFRQKTLLQRTVDAASSLDFVSRVIVLGAQRERIEEATNLGRFHVAYNQEWSEGIASSIRAGIRYSQVLNPNIAHLMFLLSDQPFVTTSLLRTLRERHAETSSGITASGYADNVGVPAILSQDFFAELLKMSGDQGAKKIINQHKPHVKVVNFDQGHFDIDTPEDLLALRDIPAATP